MLVTLRVKNLALVENVRVDFEPGLNVITGETGAGKSMLIGALGLLLGERADRRMIRSGADACGAEGVFQLRDARPLNALLDELGLDPVEEEGQLIIRRIVKAEGSGQHLVNDAPVTVQSLKRIGELLVDLHGPHEHQSLLHPDYQLSLLDAYGGLEEPRASCTNLFREWQSIREEIAALQGPESDMEGQLDLLRHRVKEIEQAAPVEGEDVQIEQEQRTAGGSQSLIESGTAALNRLVDGEQNAADALGEAVRKLEEMARLMPQAAEWRDRVIESARQVRETALSIQTALDQIDCQPERVAWLDQRLATYQKLKRKYGGSVASILEALSGFRKRLQDLETRDERLAALMKAQSEKQRTFEREAGKLSGLRKAVAGKLAQAITKELQSLGFPKSAFSVDVQEAAARASGMDQVEFGFAPNAGEPGQPLRVIASSGEMSRVMLATKAVLSRHDRIPVLVFDEVDANLGGETGLAVGRKLRDLGQRHQVLCITHLPQVAAHGGAHFAVAKQESDGRTHSSINRLSESDRANELARMMGGQTLTKSVIQHARELLKHAQG